MPSDLIHVYPTMREALKIGAQAFRKESPGCRAALSDGVAASDAEFDVAEDSAAGYAAAVN